MDEWRPETVAIRAGRPPVIAGGPLNFPITPASALGGGGYARSLDGQPPWAMLEQAIGALEGGVAVAYASGMAAAQAIMGLFGPQPTIVAPEVAYMHIRSNLLALEEGGRATVRLVDIADTHATIAACEGASVLWIESPTNPLLGIADLPALCAIARERAMLCVVDNTVATPLLQHPLALGASVVMHSATKAIGGHSDLLLGVAVTAEDALLAGLREARALQGATPGALEVYLCLRGLRTMPLRVERSQQNALELARRLEAHPQVREVRYPGLESHPQHQRAQATMDGPGFMLTFCVHGGAARADAFLGALGLLTDATSLGAVETTLERRARYAAERDIAPEDLLRVSVGCEHVEDLWADLAQALEATAGA